MKARLLPEHPKLIITLLMLVYSVDSVNLFSQSKRVFDSKCGYASCPVTNPEMLNVHIVPHSHNDVGWVLTVDEYFYGTVDSMIFRSIGVRKIISNVVKELLTNPKRRFIYVESAFFFMWWQEQTSEMQEQVKMLVKEGQLEFVGGAWSMNDEACTHYQSIIDQFSLGLRRLNDTFGECARPRVGWQIDPFGHSREMGSIFAQMGYDGLFFGRVDHEDKQNRRNTKKLEMIWRSSENLGESSDIFTGILFNLYYPPAEFQYFSASSFSLKTITNILKVLKNQAKFYRTNNILITMGGDFWFQDAQHMFNNLDELIRLVNEERKNGSEVNIMYSTPSCYLKSLHEAGITWPTKHDDFFPYSSGYHNFWTGYFTSRPSLKRYERTANHFLQVCKQLTAMLPQELPHIIPNLNLLREAMGVLQHHDAVTGTEKQYVANDYVRKLSTAMRSCGVNTRAVLNHLTAGYQPLPGQNDTHDKRHFHLDYISCNLLNISQCDVSETSHRFVLTLYNPLTHKTDEYVRIPVPNYGYLVRDSEDIVIEHQMVPVPDAVRQLTLSNSLANYELVFFAKNLPPLGYKSFYISATKEDVLPPLADKDRLQNFKSIANKQIRLLFDGRNFLSAVTSGEITRLVNQEFLYYLSMQNDYHSLSGAYIFRPDTDQVKNVTSYVKMKIYRGNLVEEAHQEFNDWISQVIRVYRGQPYAEFEWLVGPIPVLDGFGKEIITRFSSNIQSNGVFYTDSNGREMIKRQKNYRETWNLTVTEEVSSNYYPVTTKIALEDENSRMAILTDRAQGGSSLSSGSLDLMIHRRLLRDDYLGVNERLNDSTVCRGKHFLFLGSSQITNSPTLRATERIEEKKKSLPTWKFFSNAEHFSFDDWRQLFRNSFSISAMSLPQSVHLLTLEPWHEYEILVRFEHIFEKSADPILSKAVTFNIYNVFQDFEIVDIRETTLDGSKRTTDKQSLKFKFDQQETDSSENEPTSEPTISEDDSNVTTGALQHLKVDQNETDFFKNENAGKEFFVELNSMQIRTFVITLGKNKSK